MKEMGYFAVCHVEIMGKWSVTWFSFPGNHLCDMNVEAWCLATSILTDA
jgi:hypothetical protein